MSQMQRLTLNITNRLGLHARAAAKLVKLANSFRCDVRLARVESRTSQEPPGSPPLKSAKSAESAAQAVPASGSVDAKSIFGILLLAASKGAMIEVITEGADEVEAMEAVRKLIEDKFGED